MPHSCRSHSKSYFPGFIAVLSLLALVSVAAASESAAIRATATVEQPLGMVTESAAGATGSCLVYCPRQGHVICSVAYLEHVAQLTRAQAAQNIRGMTSLLLEGRIAELTPVEIILSGRQESDAGCIVTLIYTEN